ncbi:MAG: 2-dehydropantoate 2-reductase [Verrucomicrobiota bacterium]
MKITVVGCGALGSYYGAMLCRTGLDVHFLSRSDYDAVRQNGVTIRGATGGFTVRPQCSRVPEEIGESDLVIIGLKSTANDQFKNLLPPLVGKSTLVLTLQNGLGNEEKLEELFPAEQILGGLCFVCLNREQPGVVRYIDHGMVVLGEFRRRSQPRTHEIAALFQKAGIKCHVTEDLALAHWEKLVWNVPFNGLGVASAAGLGPWLAPAAQLGGERSRCLTTDKLLADGRWEAMVRELMLEVIAAAGAQGLVIPASFAEKQMTRTVNMGEYRPSTLVDYEAGRPLELESLFLEPLRQAKRHGVSVPRLETLCRILQALDPVRP